MTAPCEGIRVLDLTRGMPGNLAAMILGDFGADVLKVEAPAGDPWCGEPGWRFWNRGKRRTTVDLKSDDGRSLLTRLLADADVLIENFRPGVMERLGFGAESVLAAHPRLVYASITGFGRRGPYAHLKGYEGVVSAKTGRMVEFSGIADRPGPGYTAVATASFGALHGAVQGIAAALYRRERTGVGGHVETSLLQGNTAYDMIRWVALQRQDKDALAKDRLTSWGAITRVVPRPNYQTAVTKDGVWIQLANTMPHLYMAQLVAMGLTHLYEDPRWADLPALKDPADSKGVWEAVLDSARSKTWAEWKAIFDPEVNVAVEPFLTTQQAFDHPQIRALDHVAQVGDTEQPNVMATLPATPGSAGSLPGAAVPAAEVAWRPNAAVAASAARTEPSATAAEAPLAGVLIVDFATYFAAPFGTACLSDLGARVIKVEPPEGEYSRYVAGRMLTYKTAGGKQGLAVDLKQPEGKEIVRKLLARADMVLHNFRPGAPERLGIGYEDVKALSPNIVYHYGGSYGPAGPYAYKPAFHPIAGAVSGTALAQMPPAALGENDAGLPMEVLEQLAWRMLQANEGNPDVNAALGVGSAMALGLLARARTGLGQSQYTTMLMSGLYAMGQDAIRYEGQPGITFPDIDLYGTGPLNRLYETADGWIFVTCPFEHEWQALARATDHPEWLADPRFATAELRQANAAELAAALGAAFRTRTADDWERLLAKADVAAARADGRNVAEFCVEEPSNLELGFTVPVDHPVHGRYLRHGSLSRIAGVPTTEGPICEVGEHTRQILRELGYGDPEIDALRAKGVVYCHGE